MQEEIVMLQEWQMPRACNACHLGASVVYCYTDAMYLCSVCDSQAHDPSLGIEWHERVALCEACKQAPAAYTYEAEAVTLCARCETDIHSIHPLACQHSCTPILPIPRNHVLPFSTGDFLAEERWPKERQLDWPVIIVQGTENRDYIEFLADHKLHKYHHLEVDATNDLGGLYKYSHLELLNLGGKYDKSDLDARESVKLDVDLGFGGSKSDFNCSAPFIIPGQAGQAGNEISEVCYLSGTNTAIKTTYLVKEEHPDGPSACPSKQTKALSDRQARVLRYREKRKRRKFEKTIRYASRKAYADIRPRIKGRFAKSSDPKIRGDWLLGGTISADLNYEYAYGFGYVHSY